MHEGLIILMMVNTKLCIAIILSLMIFCYTHMMKELSLLKPQQAAVSESYSEDSPILLSSDPEYDGQPQSLAMIQRPFPMAKAHSRQSSKGKQPLHHHRPSNSFADQEFSNPSSLSDSDDQSQTYQSPIPSALHLHLDKKEQTQASHPTYSFE